MLKEKKQLEIRYRDSDSVRGIFNAKDWMPALFCPELVEKYGSKKLLERWLSENKHLKAFYAEEQHWKRDKEEIWRLVGTKVLMNAN